MAGGGGGGWMDGWREHFLREDPWVINTRIYKQADGMAVSVGGVVF